MSNARNATLAVMQRFSARGLTISFDDANTLRRAEMTLQSWGEQECGDGNDHCSWSIERDEQTGVPYRCVYPHTGTMRRTRIADREKGALRRIAEVCQRNGFQYFHQTDPRGCALYVSDKPLPSNNYTHGVACCAGA